MGFDKPKVTIDLDEYLFLKEEKSKLDTSDWYKVAKIILFAFTRYNRSFGDVTKFLTDNGVSYVMTGGTTARIDLFYDDISIAYNPKK